MLSIKSHDWFNCEDTFSDSATFPQRRIELRLENASTIDRGEIVRKEDEQRTDVTNDQCNCG